MKPLVRLFLVALAAVTLAAAQSAPSKQAEVRGIVTDPQTARIAGATVTFTPVPSGAAVSVRTAADGSYRAELSPGSYRVSVKAPGFVTDASRSIKALSGKTLQLDFEMKVADLGGIEVWGASEQPSSEPPSTPGISVIKFVAPVYPPLAKTARMQGDVRLLVEIAPDGSAKDVKLLSGHPILTKSAIEAVKQWRFGCQRCEGVLIQAVTVSFLFDSEGDNCVAPGRLPDDKVEAALPSRVTVKTPGCLVVTESLLTCNGPVIVGQGLNELPLGVMMEPPRPVARLSVVLIARMHSAAADSASSVSPW